MTILRPSAVASPKLVVKALAVSFFFLCTLSVTLCAQEGGPPTDGKQVAGIPAGGKWLEFQSEDKMTGAQKNRFELEADNLLPDSDAKAKVLLFCVGGKLALGDFRPNAWTIPAAVTAGTGCTAISSPWIRTRFAS